ncbi:MAG TPA: hypothetical protein VL132_07300 [Planctomycetaceae bacterium]|nr:hypothetical protein [Planctomycetaceae bacterium]
MLQRSHPIDSLLLALALTVVCSGCLSIGGKLALEDSPNTQARLSSLEARMSAVEQSVGGAGAVSMSGQ